MFSVESNIVASEKTGVAKEGSAQRKVLIHPMQPAAHSAGQVIQILLDRVGQGRGVQMRPKLLDGVQFRGVGRQGFQPQPVAMAGEGPLGETTAMSGQPVPQQDHWAAPMALQPVQEARDVAAADTTPMQGQQPARAPTVGGGEHGADARQPLPVEGFDHARGLPSGSPRGADRWTLRKATFVHKTQPSLQPLGVFFTWGQRPRPQRRMATSLRSRARRAGRWRLHPSWRNTRQVWERE